MTRQPESTKPLPETGSRTALPKQDSIEEALGRVFISPRVVDQRSLEEFAGQLRGLVKDAATQERALRAAGAEIKVIDEHLRESARALRTQLEARGGVIDAAKVEALARAGVEKALAERPVGRTPEGSPGAMPDSDETLARARSARAALEAAADEAVVKVTALVRQVEAAENRVAASAAAVGMACERAAALVAEIDSRGANATETARDARLDTESWVGEAGARLGAALGEAERRAQTVTTGLEAALVDFERRARLMQEQFEPSTAARAEPLASTCATDLRDLIGEAHRVGEALSRLLSRADAVGRALDRLTRESHEIAPASPRTAG